MSGSSAPTPRRGRGADRGVGFGRVLHCKLKSMPCVYILQFAKGEFYIGSTVDLDRRIKQHASGHTPATKRLGEGKLVFKQDYRTLKDARAVEYKLKKLKRHDYIAKIVEDGYIRIKPA